MSDEIQSKSQSQSPYVIITYHSMIQCMFFFFFFFSNEWLRIKMIVFLKPETVSVDAIISESLGTYNTTVITYFNQKNTLQHVDCFIRKNLKSNSLSFRQQFNCQVSSINDIICSYHNDSLKLYPCDNVYIANKQTKSICTSL